MIGLGTLFDERPGLQRSKNLNLSHSNLPRVNSMRVEPMQSALTVVQRHSQKSFSDKGFHNIFCKIRNSTAQLWVLLMMIPYIQRIANWRAAKQIRVKNLQDRCIQKAHGELRKETEIEGWELYQDCCQIVKQMKTRSISNWEKQYHQDYCIASNLNNWKTTQRILKSDLKCIERFYRSTHNEKELIRHLAMPRQPVV